MHYNVWRFVCCTHQIMIIVVIIQYIIRCATLHYYFCNAFSIKASKWYQTFYFILFFLLMAIWGKFKCENAKEKKCNAFTFLCKIFLLLLIIGVISWQFLWDWAKYSIQENVIISHVNHAVQKQLTQWSFESVCHCGESTVLLFRGVSLLKVFSLETLSPFRCFDTFTVRL